MQLQITAHREGLGDVLEGVLRNSYFRPEEKAYLRRYPREISKGALDTRVALSQTRFLHPIAEAMREILESHRVSQIVGKGYGSFFLIGGILGLGNGITGGLLRDSRKSYGFRQLVEGGLDKTKPVFIIDDVLSTGQAAGETVKHLRREGFHPAGLLTVFRYGWYDGEKSVRSLGLDCLSLGTLDWRTLDRKDAQVPESSKEDPMRLRVIRSWREARAHNPYEPALVEVPGKWIHAVLHLIKVVERHRHVGLLVTNVGRETPAAKAGMERGDLLLRCDGVDLDRVGTLRRLVRNHPRETSHQVVIEGRRGGEDRRFELHRGRLGITVSGFFRRQIPERH